MNHPLWAPGTLIIAEGRNGSGNPEYGAAGDDSFNAATVGAHDASCYITRAPVSLYTLIVVRISLEFPFLRLFVCFVYARRARQNDTNVILT